MNEEKQCIYNNVESTIKIDSDRIVVNNKNILYKDIHSIKTGFLTEYMSLFNASIIFFCVLITVLLCQLLLGVINITYIFMSLLLAFIIIKICNTYYINKTKYEYFQYIDIIYPSHHDTILLKKSDGIVVNTKHIKKLNFFQTRLVQKYNKRIFKTREYIFKQLEFKKTTANELRERYITVAEVGYDIKPNFSASVLSNIENIHNKYFSTQLSLAYLLMRVNLFLLAIILASIFGII